MTLTPAQLDCAVGALLAAAAGDALGASSHPWIVVLAGLLAAAV
jgi:hypothetical protein